MAIIKNTQRYPSMPPLFTSEYQTFRQAINILEQAGYKTGRIKIMRKDPLYTCAYTFVYDTITAKWGKSTKCGVLSVSIQKGMPDPHNWFIDAIDYFDSVSAGHECKIAMKQGGSVCWPKGSLVYGFWNPKIHRGGKEWLNTLGHYLEPISGIYPYEE